MSVRATILEAITSWDVLFTCLFLFWCMHYHIRFISKAQGSEQGSNWAEHKKMQRPEINKTMAKLFGLSIYCHRACSNMYLKIDI